jgi:hypothetical protein
MPLKEVILFREDLCARSSFKALNLKKNIIAENLKNLNLKARCNGEKLKHFQASKIHATANGMQIY